MATWEDGPEYAPRERPAAFAVPATPPLPEPALQPSLAAGAPRVAPDGYRPDPRASVVPQRPLAELVPIRRDVRDPHEAFAVVASAATATDSAWSAAHHHTTGALVDGGFDPHAPLSVASSDPTGFAPPTGPPVRPADLPFAPHSGEPAQPGWFAPAPAQGPVSPPGASFSQRFVDGITPGVLITLLASTFVPVVAPVGYLTAFGLATRTRVRGGAVRTIFALGTTCLILVALAGLVIDGQTPESWWGATGGTAAVISGLTLLLVCGIVAWAVREDDLPQP